MAQQVKAHTALAEDDGTVSSIYSRQLKSICNSSSSKFNIAGLRVDALPWTCYTQSCINNKSKIESVKWTGRHVQDTDIREKGEGYKKRYIYSISTQVYVCACVCICIFLHIHPSVTHHLPLSLSLDNESCSIFI